MYYLLKTIVKPVSDLEHGELHPSDYYQRHRITRDTIVRATSGLQAINYFVEALNIERIQDFSVAVFAAKSFSSDASSIFKGVTGNYYYDHVATNLIHSKDKNTKKKKRKKMATTNIRGKAKGGIVIDEAAPFDEATINQLKKYAKKEEQPITANATNNTTVSADVSPFTTGGYIGKATIQSSPEDSTVEESNEIFSTKIFNRTYGAKVSEEIVSDDEPYYGFLDDDDEDYEDDYYDEEDYEDPPPAEQTRATPSTEEITSFIDEVLKVENDDLPEWARNTEKKTPDYRVCCWRCEGPLPKGRSTGNACDECYADLEKE
jgi:hypothetical protein